MDDAWEGLSQFVCRLRILPDEIELVQLKRLSKAVKIGKFAKIISSLKDK